MNQIQQLQFGQKELCECEKYARTKPDELIALLNTIFYQKSQVSEGSKQVFKRIISNVDRYITKSEHIVSDAVRSIQAKIISWDTAYKISRQEFAEENMILSNSENESSITLNLTPSPWLAACPTCSSPRYSS